MSFEIEVHGRNLTITDRINDYVKNKITRLDRYLPGIDEARIDLSQVKSGRSASDRQVAQITIRGKGFILRSEERTDDIFSAFDTALDKIQRRIERYKGKRYRGRGDGVSIADFTSEMTPDDETGELGPAIARRKKFILVPMDEKEALDQMELLGHEDFFVFYNVNTNSVNVLYKRRDGSYGLIESEVG